MAIGSWDPDAAKADEALVLDQPLLTRLAALGEAPELAALQAGLGDDEVQRLAGLMQVPETEWQQATNQLGDDAVLRLLRFFAVAENLPGWEAGAQSPVIPLAKALRRRGRKLDRELLLWLKKVNDNRFLPYGPL